MIKTILQFAFYFMLSINCNCFVGMAAATNIQSQAIIIDHNCIDQKDCIIPLAWLNKARKLNVFFGHQSVGWNILEGLESLASENNARYRVNIIENPPPGWFATNTGIGHADIGENGNPIFKIRDFNTKVSKHPGYGRNLNAALVKICFADINSQTNVKEIWNEYVSNMDNLKRRFPNLTLVWCTCPIVSNESNERREAFNKLVREYCQNSHSMLYDIADIEAYTPASKVCVMGSQKILCKTYSQDGEHPDSDAGKQRLARGWWWMLARVAGWDGH